MSEREKPISGPVEEASGEAPSSTPEYAPAPLWLPVLLVLAMALIIGYGVIVR
jgi:hypothetical protein